MTKINSCTYLNPCSKEFSDTNEKFKKLSGDKKFLVVLATFFAGVASFFMGGLGGLAAYRHLVQKFANSPTAKKTDDVKNKEGSLVLKKTSEEDLKKAEREREIAEIARRAKEAEKEEEAQKKKREAEVIEKEREEFANVPPAPVGYELQNFMKVQAFFQGTPSDELIEKIAKSSVWKHSRERLVISDFAREAPLDKIALITKSVADSPRHIREMLRGFLVNMGSYEESHDFSRELFEKNKQAVLTAFETLDEKQKLAFITLDPAYNQDERIKEDCKLEFIAPLLIGLKEELKLTPEFLAEAQKFVKDNGPRLMFPKKTSEEAPKKEEPKETANYAWVKTVRDVEKFFKQNPSDEEIQKIAKSTVLNPQEGQLTFDDFAKHAPLDEIGIIIKSVADKPTYIRELLTKYMHSFDHFSPHSTLPDSEMKRASFERYKKAIITIFENLNETERMALITVKPSDPKAEQQLNYLAPRITGFQEELKFTETFFFELTNWIRV